MLPHDLLMGSAFGWLYEHIQGYEAGEKKRTSKREEAEKLAENNLFEAACKQLHQWIPQPVPDDFVCPYTGNAVDKRKILATGAKHEKIDGAAPSERKSYLYSGHDTLVVYRTGFRGQWYVAREIWDGAKDSEDNRMGVDIQKVPFGEVTVTRQLGVQSPGLPHRGVKGYSGQPGRPILRDQSDRPPRPGPMDPNEVFQTRTGYRAEADARKQAMLYVLSSMVRGERAAIMGMEHVDLTRAKRLRGGARRKAEVHVSPPASETPGERHTATIPAHLWSGEVVEDNAPRIVKKRRVRKKLEDSEEIREIIRNNQIRALS
jgi:hypothetical protein